MSGTACSGGAPTYAGLTETEARERALSAGASIRDYGQLRLGSLAHLDAPNGEQYWDATLLDAQETKRVCVRLSRSGVNVRDCSEPDAEPPGLSDPSDPAPA